MYHSFYLRLKPIGYLRNNKSYQIVITHKSFNKNIPYKFIDKVGLILNLRSHSKRKDRIILLDSLKLKYWFLKKVRITKDVIYYLFFCNYNYDQGCKSFLTLFNTRYLNNYLIKIYGYDYCLKANFNFKAMALKKNIYKDV